MITVTIYRQPDGFISRFEAYGHAGQAEAGQDIICAGVSAIAQTVIGSLQELASLEPDYGLDDGDIYCDIGDPVKLSAEQRVKASALMGSMDIGCQQISSSYGREYVTVKNKSYY
ncbi:MAG: ribosomal-processing cysteine protease Prp [Clostridiaceae bacterium]|nr:ribosomal-processing cysteine protease Prp [Clostridiaceae bacterium]